MPLGLQHVDDPWRSSPAGRGSACELIARFRPVWFGPPRSGSSESGSPAKEAGFRYAAGADS